MGQVMDTDRSVVTPGQILDTEMIPGVGGIEIYPALPLYTIHILQVLYRWIRGLDAWISCCNLEPRIA
jgi:hypothetical protein